MLVALAVIAGVTWHAMHHGFESAAAREERLVGEDGTASLLARFCTDNCIGARARVEAAHNALVEFYRDR